MPNEIGKRAQGIKAALALADLDPAAVGEPLPEASFCAAVNVILSYQNSNGGWPTYELMRSFEALELINPAETFGGIMVDYSYVECSSACMTALAAFRARYPEHRRAEIAAALERGRKFVESIQRKDGSWCGPAGATIRALGMLSLLKVFWCPPSHHLEQNALP
jgi:cycloartenol synthase